MSAVIFVPPNILSSTFGLLQHCLFILINNGEGSVTSGLNLRQCPHYTEDIKIFVKLEPLH